MRSVSILLFALLLCLLALERPAQAYLDPGSGSMLLQVLLGGFAAVGVIGRLVWNRLRERLARRPPEAPDGAATHDDIREA